MGIFKSKIEKMKQQRDIDGLAKLADKEADQNEFSDKFTEAVQALGEIGGESAIAALATIIEIPRVYGARMSLIEVLRNIGKPAVPTLIETLKGDTDIQHLASEALIELNEVAVPALIETLKSKAERSSIRSSIARVLGKVAYEAAVPALVEIVMNTEESKSTRDSSFNALGNIPVETAARALVEIYKGDDYNPFLNDLKVRRRVTKALRSRFKTGKLQEAVKDAFINSLRNLEIITLTQMKHGINETRFNNLGGQVPGPAYNDYKHFSAEECAEAILTSFYRSWHEAWDFWIYKDHVSIGETGASVGHMYSGSTFFRLEPNAYVQHPWAEYYEEL